MIQAEKQRLRAHLRSLPPPSPEGATELHAVIAELAEWQTASSVLLYAPLHGEPDPTGILAQHGHKSFLFPRISGDFLELFRWSPGSDWIVGPFGVREPDPGTWERVEPGNVDLALIPGLAFDTSGRRLGRGRGYYDRLLGDRGFRAIKAGLCPEDRLLTEIPIEPHDVLMDLIITGQRVIRPSSRLDNPAQSG
ncbi:MAG: 5-formyltetrahydrofolate cyclo-ligase [Chthoniobacterales bacterium]